MKINIALLLALGWGCSVVAQTNLQVIVSGDRVSLRAAPEANAVVMGRLMMGDKLVVKDNLNPNWVGVTPPAGIDFWVNRDFVSNRLVSVGILNVRSGPSVSHSVVGTAQKGDLLSVRGEVDSWLKVAPTSNTMLWVSRQYVEFPHQAVPVKPVEKVAEKVVEKAVEPSAAVIVITEPPATNTPAKVKEPNVEEMLTSISLLNERKLTPDPKKAQGVQGGYTGILQQESRSLYKLMDPHFKDVTICYVRGNMTQLKTFEGTKLELTGKVYWSEGLKWPILVPAKLRPISKGE